MNYQLLQQVIADQKIMVKTKDRGQIRSVDPSVHLSSGLISVVSGVRRSGKSTFTLQMADQFPAFHFMNFDDERLIGFMVSDFNEMLIEFKKEGNIKTIVLDEIQLIDGWERFVRRLHDEGYKVFITGSNAKLLSSELATHLTGRYLKTELYPFSFGEFLRWKGISPLDYSSENKAVILNAFDEYLFYGGFPEFLKTGTQEILKNIYNDIVYRDLIVRFGIRNLSGFKNLSQYLFANFTDEAGYLTLAKLLGFQSATSVRDYISILQEGYLVFEVNQYDHGLKRRYASNRKIYVIDNGLRNSISFRTSSDMGRLLENMVFLELKRRDGEVWYFRSATGKETDFLINPSDPSLFQVCYDLANPVTRSREVTSLKACMKELDVKAGYLLSMNEEGELNEKEGMIRIIPVWKWMLQP